MRVAAVDIGTNTVRLLVANAERVDGRVSLSEVERRSKITRLGSGVDEFRRLDSKAVDASLRALREYGAVVRSLAVDGLDAVATSAVRDAVDGDAFLGEAAQALGTRPRVITGDEEAALSFAGATLGVSGPGPHLVIDLGGGSTEFVFGTAEPQSAVSVDIGSVRLTERRLPRHPASKDDVAAARAEAARVLAASGPARAGVSVIGVGGTFSTLAMLLLDVDRDQMPHIAGTRLEAHAFEGVVTRLAKLTVDETAALGAVEPGRAPVLLGGAIVAAEALAAVGAEAIVLSLTDILDGLALAVASTRAG